MWPSVQPELCGCRAPHKASSTGGKPLTWEHTHTLTQSPEAVSHFKSLGRPQRKSPWVDHGDCGPPECVKALSPGRDACLLEAPALATLQPGAARRDPRARPAAQGVGQSLFPARPPHLSSLHCPHTHGQKQRTSDIADTASSTERGEKQGWKSGAGTRQGHHGPGCSLVRGLSALFPCPSAHMAF